MATLVKILSVSVVVLLASGVNAVGQDPQRNKPVIQEEKKSELSTRMERAFETEIKAGKVVVAERPKYLLVSINIPGMFEAGNDRASPELRALLGRVAQELKQSRSRVQVVSHTDSDPIATAEFPSNQALTQKRAMQAVKILMEHTGKTIQYDAIGRGDMDPIRANDTLEGKRTNRRLEIIVLSPE